MTIAITVDPEIPVPPKHYGGIERIVDLLVRGLMQRGHRVVLFANRKSEVPCELEAYPAERSQNGADLLRNMAHVASRIRCCRPTLVHSFGRLAYLLPLLPLALPKIMTYQRIITRRSVAFGERLARGTLHFTGCSGDLIKAFAGKPNWHVVYNGVSDACYTANYDVPANAPLIFLGRVEEIKGPHIAIEAAGASGRRLIIAGNVPDEAKHRDFFDRCIRPHVDGRTVEYVGPVTDEEKNNLLRNAAALLMPVLWNEPFGIVMAEALACGTPVIGFRRGAIPEVVTDGVNGFVCSSPSEMSSLIGSLGQIDRRACRRIFQEKLSDTVMVEAYTRVYAQAC